MHNCYLMSKERGDALGQSRKRCKSQNKKCMKIFYVPLDGLHTRLGEGFRKATGSTRRAEHSAHYEKVT